MEKTSAELRAELAELDLAENLAKLGGYGDMVIEAKKAKLEIYGILEGRKERNEAQRRAYKSAVRGK